MYLDIYIYILRFLLKRAIIDQQGFLCSLRPLFVFLYIFFSVLYVPPFSSFFFFSVRHSRQSPAVYTVRNMELKQQQQQQPEPKSGRPFIVILVAGWLLAPLSLPSAALPPS